MDAARSAAVPDRPGPAGEAAETLNTVAEIIDADLPLTRGDK
jgi:hypothetical protein